MISLLKYLKGSWDNAKGYLETDLEHIETALNQLEADVFDIDTRTLLASIIAGNSTVVPRYVANTGKNNAPKWDQVDLGSTGVKNRLPFSHIVAATLDSVLVGRESGSTGDFEQILLGDLLAMNGTTLDFADQAQAAVYLELDAIMGSVGVLL